MATAYIHYPPSQLPIYATFADLPPLALPGAQAVVRDTDSLYIYDAISGWVLVASGTIITGVTSVGPVGSSPNANAATITGNVLNLQPASASFPGVVTTLSQTLAGAKTFTGKMFVDVADPLGGHAFRSRLTVNSNISVTDHEEGGLFSVSRISANSVSDTQPMAAIALQLDFTLPALSTYTNSSSINILQISGVSNANSSPITTPFYALVNFNDDANVVSGRKYGVFLPAITNGTHNAVLADSGAFTGNWFLNQSNAALASAHVGPLRVGRAGQAFTSGTTEKLSLTDNITSPPVTEIESFCLLQTINTASALTGSLVYGHYVELLRNSPTSVTDTSFYGAIVGAARYDLPAGQTYTNTSSVNVVRVDPLQNINGCTLAINSYRGFRLNDDVGTTGGRKIGFRWGAWSGGTNNAVFADNEPTGNWFISKIATTLPSLLNGSLINATGALATNATDGFIYLPTCAGTPTGVPTTFTGTVPIVYDTTGGKLYTRVGGSWVATFTLPSFTANSVIFSNGTTLVEDNANFNFDPGSESLFVGGNVTAGGSLVVDVDAYISGNLSLITEGSGLLIKEGSDATMGQVTLAGGTATVLTNKVTSNSRIFLSVEKPSGVPGFISAPFAARSDNVSFQINSTSALDTSNVYWLIIQPA